MTANSNAKTGMTLAMIAHDGKALGKLVNTTIASYKKVAIALHNTAAATLFHAAQYGEASTLTSFYNGLRINDQTALRVWVGTHATYVDLDTGKVKPWMTWNKKEGFRVVKGTEQHRKDMFTVGEDVQGRTDLLATKPFYEKNVQDKDAYTLERLIAMLVHTAERVERESEKENITLPKEIEALVHDVEKTAGKTLEDLERARKEAEKREANAA